MANLFSNAIKVGKGLLTTKTLVIGGLVAALAVVGYATKGLLNEEEEEESVVDIEAEEVNEEEVPHM